MNSNINKILEQIEEKRQELIKAYNELKENYHFKLKGKKVFFDKKEREKNKKMKKNPLSSILSITLRDFISIPFIYGMAIPTLVLDIGLFIYKNICFRLYRIPMVYRKDYIIYDRKYLDYLNIFQKFNCLYCSRVNGLFSYAVEIAGRTELYRCPIKASQKMKGGHNWQSKFADYGDAVGFKECYNKLSNFKN